MFRHILLFIFIFTGVSQATELPDLGDSSYFALGTKDKHKLARAFNQQLQQSGNIINDALLQDYLQTLGQNLLAASSPHQQSYTFILLKDDSINAFAGPEGLIGVNSGLIKACESESELAAVLAHEIAHVKQGHLLSHIQHNKRMRLPMVLGSLASLAIGSAAPSVGQGLLIGTMAGMQQDAINFTRAHEKEADNIGMRILYNAHYDPKSMGQFFKRIQQQQRLYDSKNYPDFLRTHPISANRIAEANSRAANYPKTTYKTPSLNFKLLKQRNNFLSTTNYHQALLNAQLLARQYPDNVSYQYRYALTLAQSHDLYNALAIVEKLLSNAPDSLVLILLKSRLLTDLHRYKEALSLLNQTYQNHPSFLPLALAYGKTLLLANKPKQAEQLFRRLTLSHPQYIAVYLLQARALAASGAEAEAYLIRAQVFIKIGNTQLAADQLKKARLLAKTAYVKSRINATMHKLKKRS